MEDIILEMKHVTMDFPGVRALDDVSFLLKRGEIHALVGENGAGKSTLMKILLGLYKPVNGEIHLNGERVKISSPTDALSLGISMMHQEISLVNQMSVCENIWLGREKDFSRHGVLDVKARLQKTQALLQRLKIPLDPHATVGSLSIANMQLVEIARAVSYDSRIIIMDEPTSALTNEEVSVLFDIIRDLSSNGVGIIFISHKLEELLTICDAITVLRDGKYVASCAASSVDKAQLVKLIAGREIKELYPKDSSCPGETLLEVRDLCKEGVFQNVSFQVRRGEILGICGLMGAGRTEILEAIFGVNPADSGEIVIKGKPVTIRNPGQAIKSGLGFVTEDRLHKGIIGKIPVKVNISIAYIKSICKAIFLNTRKELADCRSIVDSLQIKVSNINQIGASLSGGNQQKVIIGRSLLTNPEIMLLDEPTRGIDVGSKSQIYRLMNDLAKQGMAIVMVSSEMPEVMGMSDRIIVVSKGRITAEVERNDFDQERLMEAAFLG